MQVIIITAHGTLDTAVRSMKLGAVEYLAKPIDLDQARKVIESALAKVPVSREVERLRSQVGPGFGDIVGQTPAMQEVFKKVAAVCESDANVLLVGESGTGKELVARAIHANSKRASGPFEPINCASIPETLLESELFGHEKGAFTGAVRMKQGKFEIAHGGTIFLDEVGDLPMTTQVKFLRFVEERSFTRVGSNEKISVDVRIVSASNSNIEAGIAEGRFREDLYFRLNVMKIDVPPLRDRREDIPPLVAHFVEHVGAKGISQAALDKLKRRSWPGNVRELKHAIERGALLARHQTIQPEHLPESELRPKTATYGDWEGKVEEAVRLSFDELDTHRGAMYKRIESVWESAVIKVMLEVTQGNQRRAAELLGINRVTLRRKMRMYGLKEEERGEDDCGTV
jgi:DNA-binding NtrC family response regulator